MFALDIRDNRVEYAGLFERPLFKLWGDGATILAGLFDALAPYHDGLKSFTSSGDAVTAAEQSVTVNLGWQGQFRFKFDRVESHLHSFTDDQLAKFPAALEAGTGWLKAHHDGALFSAHLVTYRCHALPLGTTSQQFLGALQTPRLKGLGPNSNAGLILHGNTASPDAKIQLIVDQSLRFTDGLFIEFQAFVASGVVQYAPLLDQLRASLVSLLTEIDLELRRDG